MTSLKTTRAMNIYRVYLIPIIKKVNYGHAYKQVNTQMYAHHLKRVTTNRYHLRTLYSTVSIIKSSTQNNKTK